MKEIYNQFIGVYENAFEDGWCDEVINLFKKYSEDKIDRKEYWGDRPHHAKDQSLEFEQLYNTYTDTEGPNILKIKEYMDKVIDLTLFKYIRNYSIDLPGYDLSSYKIQRTSPAEGYHLWHCESPFLHNYVADGPDGERAYAINRRFAAYTIYLNDIDEGGETEFLNQSLRLPPKKGSLCIFPSNFTHLHRGNPPLKDNKYIVTGWFLLKEEKPRSNG